MPRTKELQQNIARAQVRKDPGGQRGTGRDIIVRSRIDVQLSNVSWNHKRRDSVNVRLAADLKN